MVISDGKMPAVVITAKEMAVRSGEARGGEGVGSRVPG
jgi:hypothetical protein